MRGRRMRTGNIDEIPGGWFILIRRDLDGEVFTSRFHWTIDFAVCHRSQSASLSASAFPDALTAKYLLQRPLIGPLESPVAHEYGLVDAASLINTVLCFDVSSQVAPYRSRRLVHAQFDFHCWGTTQASFFPYCKPQCHFSSGPERPL